MLYADTGGGDVLAQPIPAGDDGAIVASFKVPSPFRAATSSSILAATEPQAQAIDLLIIPGARRCSGCP